MRDSAAGPGWSPVLDVDRAPVEWLGWLAQFAGVRLRPGLAAPEQRARIKNTDGHRRGSSPALRAAARQHLQVWDVVATNLVPNPSFETNTDGWAIAGGWAIVAGGTLTRDTTVAQFGTASARVDTTATNQGIAHTFSGTFRAGVTYRISGWLRSNVGENARFLIGNDGNDAGGQQLVLAANTWTRYSFLWTPSADRVNPSLHAQHMGATAVRSLWVDGVMVIETSADPSYFDGSTVPPESDRRARWTGAAHASRSVLEVKSSRPAYVIINERLSGSAYRLGVVTLADETADPALTEAAIREQKPAGVVLTFNTVRGQTYVAIRTAYNTYLAVRNAYASYADLRSNLPR